MKSNLQTISIPKLIKPERCFKDIELEGVLPDYSPDISRLVRVDASPYVESVKCDTKCEISGRIIFGLLYESDYKSKLAYTTFQTPFELKCDHVPAKESYPDMKCECTYLTCRLLGQRKVSVKAKIDASVSGTQVDDFTVVEPDSGDLNMFFKTNELNVSLPVARTEAVAEIKENIRLDEAVASVIYAQAVFAPAETEAFDTSASVKSSMALNALCELPDGSYKMISKNVPIEVSVKSDAINSDCELDAALDYSELSAVADLDEYGENKIINMKCTLRATATVRKNSKLVLPVDAFNRKHSCKCVCSDAAIDAYVPQTGKTVSIERSHATDGDLTAVLGSTSSYEITEMHQSGDLLNIKGKVKTDVLAQSGESVVSRTFSDEFEDSMPYSGDGEPVFIDVSVFESKAELYGDALNIRTMAFIKPEYTERKQLSILTSVELGEAEEAQSHGFRFYYPDQNETLWDIAKKYRTDPERLKTDNADRLNDDGKLVGKRYLCIKS